MVAFALFVLASVTPGPAETAERPTPVDKRVVKVVTGTTAGSEGSADGPNRQAFDLSWWSVDGGGGESAGGSFTLTADIGQPESGLASSDGRVLDAGLWSGVTDNQPLFCDGFETGNTSAWDRTVGG